MAPHPVHCGTVGCTNVGTKRHHSSHGTAYKNEGRRHTSPSNHLSDTAIVP
jgi:hypothetical protein